MKSFFPDPVNDLGNRGCCDPDSDEWKSENEEEKKQMTAKDLLIGLGGLFIISIPIIVLIIILWLIVPSN